MNLYKQLKFELFITLKNKSTYIILLISVCFFTFFTIMMYNSPTGEIMTPGDLSISNVNSNIQNNNSLSDYLENLICSDAIIMFVTIFSSLIALQEFKNDYIKNIWILLGKKKIFLFAKIAVISIFVFVLYLLAFLVVIVCNLIFINTSFGDITELIKLLPLQIVMEIAFGVLTMAASLLIGHTVPAVITCIVYVSFAHNILCSFVNMIVNKASSGSENFNVDDYLLFGNILLLKTGVSGELIIRALIIAALVLSISYILSLLSINRKYK